MPVGTADTSVVKAARMAMLEVKKENFMVV
jgi:hypothetical protein